MQEEIDYYEHYCSCSQKKGGQKSYFDRSCSGCAQHCTCFNIATALAVILSVFLVWNFTKIPYTISSDSLTNATAADVYASTCLNMTNNATPPSRCWGLVVHFHRNVSCTFCC